MIRKICLLLSLYASLSACKKSDTGIPDTSTFVGRFNGFLASVSTSDTTKGRASYIATNVPISANQSNGSYTSILSSRYFSIGISKATLVFAGNAAPSSAEFLGFFSAGSVPFLSATNPNGIAIEYVDNSGTSWNSAIGDQTGSSFIITQSQASGINVKIESQFTCNLYDGNGHTIALSGGMFTGQFHPQ